VVSVVVLPAVLGTRCGVLVGRIRLAGTVLALAEPAEVVGVDPSEGFPGDARARIGDPRSSFLVRDGRSPPSPG
jgi:hypothetical protein